MTRYFKTPLGLSSAWGIALTGLAALAVAMGIGRFAFTPILPMMQSDVGISVAEGGWLASANYLGYLFGALSAIRTTLRPTTVIRYALLTIGISTLAMGFELSFFGWMVLRAIAGIASAWVLVFVSAWALDRLVLVDRQGMSGAVYAGVGVGILGAGSACVILMSLHARAADAWISLGLASLAIATAVWGFLTPNLSPTLAAIVAPGREQRWNAEFWRLILCYGAFGFGYIIPATFLPVMAKEVIADPYLFGLAWPAFGAAAFLSTLLAAGLHRFVSHRTVWITGNLVMALGVAFPLLVPGLSGIIIASLCVGGTFMVITMAGMQEARRLAGPQAPALMAAMTSAFALGQIIGPLSVSVLSSSTGGFGPALIVATAFLVLSAIALMRRASISTAVGTLPR